MEGPSSSQQPQSSGVMETILFLVSFALGAAIFAPAAADVFKKRKRR
jgi:hypothetical protein